MGIEEIMSKLDITEQGLNDLFENKSNDINQKENFDGPSWKAKRLTDSFIIFLSDL